MNPQQPYGTNNNQPVNGPQPQVYGPQQQPNLSNNPYQPGFQNQPGPPGPINDPEEPPKSHKKLIVACIAAAVIIVLIILGVLIASALSNKPTQTKKQGKDETMQTEALQPAKSVEMEQTSNSLSQDMSRLDDEKDLPTKSLDDDTLGL